jgi:quinol monooxygenase YgiN
MLQHIVLFRLKEDVDEPMIAERMADFVALAEQIAEIARLEVRRDIVGRPVSSHFGLISEFADQESLRRYQQHPAHVAAFERLKPYLDQMLVLDYVQ